MLLSSRLQTGNGRLRGAYTCGDFSLGKASFGTSLEYFVEEGEFLVKFVICFANGWPPQGTSPELLQRTTHLSLPSSVCGQCPVPWMGSSESSSRNGAAS